MTSKNRRSSGFTLIELLVVISIIAILISILLPALSSALQQARKVRDQANMKAIGALAQTYASDDPNGVIGPVHPYATHFIYEGYAEYGGGPGTMVGDGNFNYFGWGHEMDPRTRPFNRIMYGDNGIVANTAPGARGVFETFQCPGNELGWQEWPGFGSSPRETESPYFKGNGVAFRMNNLPYDDGNTNGIYGRSINRIPDTSTTVGWMEARVFQTLFTNEVTGFLEPGELISYHAKTGFFNVIYCDGHAAFVDFGKGTYYQHKYFDDHTEFNELDARGSWGKMDCFPEPFVMRI